MKLTRKRLIGLILGITVFLGAFGIAFAAFTWYQVSQTVPSAVNVTSTIVISGDNISLWWDQAKLQPVTGDPAIEWTKAQTSPPLRQVNLTSDVWLYIVNESPYNLIPVDPCHDLRRTTDNVWIGSTHTNLFSLDGNWRGNACDGVEWRKDSGYALAPGEMWQLRPHPHFDRNLASGSHNFDLVFGAVGYAAAAGSGPISSEVVISAPEDHHPRPPSE